MIKLFKNVPLYKTFVWESIVFQKMTDTHAQEVNSFADPQGFSDDVEVSVDPTDTYYTYKIDCSSDVSFDLRAPFSDPRLYEDPFDLTWQTPDEARQGMRDWIENCGWFNEEDIDKELATLILVEVTVRPLE